MSNVRKMLATSLKIMFHQETTVNCLMFNCKLLIQLFHKICLTTLICYVSILEITLHLQINSNKFFANKNEAISPQKRFHSIVQTPESG